MANRFFYLRSNEIQTGLWGWAKRLVDELNKLAKETAECCAGGGDISGGEFDIDDGSSSGGGSFELDEGGA